MDRLIKEKILEKAGIGNTIVEFFNSYELYDF
jgi:hypothetical protein